VQGASNARAFDFAQRVSVESDPSWLPRALEAAARGEFPTPDHKIRLVPPVAGARGALIAFTGHHVIASPLDPDAIGAAIRDRGVQLPTDPRFLAWLADALGGSSSEDTIDVVLARKGIERTAHPPMVPFDDAMLADRRIAFAAETRTELRIYRPADESAVVVLGHGLAGRLEMSIELAAGRRGSGQGEELAAIALAQAGPDSTVFAQVSPGNAAALRAATRGGFQPVCAEYLVR
jgi:hypothetical protein